MWRPHGLLPWGKKEKQLQTWHGLVSGRLRGTQQGRGGAVRARTGTRRGWRVAGTWHLARTPRRCTASSILRGRAEDTGARRTLVNWETECGGGGQPLSVWASVGDNYQDRAG